jgi:hypothetical protein
MSAADAMGLAEPVFGLAEGKARGPSYDVRHAPIAGRANPKFSRSVVPE